VTDADGICASQTPLAAGALTINGALAASGTVTLATAQHVSVYCAGADSARSFIVTGTDWLGNALTETIAGAATNTTSGTKNFKTITSITVDAATAGEVTVGVLGVLETPWLPLNTYAQPFNYSYFVDIGVATYTLEGTLDNVQDSTVTPVAFTVQSSATGDSVGSSTVPVRAVRVKVTSYTSGTIVFKIMQAGS